MTPPASIAILEAAKPDSGGRMQDDRNYSAACCKVPIGFDG